MKIKRIISFMLCMFLLFSILPFSAFAADTNGDKTRSQNTLPFTDVPEDAWYYEGVRYVYQNNIFSGTSAHTFDPDGNMTRGMFVTVLGRMAGVDTKRYAGDSGFSDVSADDYYAPYVAWASKYEITLGTGNGQFSPDALINREQMATFFVRYFEKFEVEYDTGSEIPSTPSDFDGVSDYAKSAVLKLWRNGLLIGDGISFDFAGKATRAQAATLCMRICQAVKNWYSEPKEITDPVILPIIPHIPGSTSYLVTFETNGGTSVPDRTVADGAEVGEFPAPYKRDSIFLGWYYDEALTNPAASEDEVHSALKLYAKYDQTGSIEEIETPAFATALDRDVDFTIEIISETDMTAAEVKALITAVNVSAIDNRELIEVTGSGKSFVVSGINYNGNNNSCQAGFEKGSTYKLTLNDDRLYFAGQNVSVREYDFTISQSDVMNLSLKSDIKNIKLSQISNLTVNGVPSNTISIPLITVGGESAPTTNGSTVGSFTYTAGTLSVGETVAITNGSTTLDLENSGTDSEAAFVIITSVNGNGSYSYKSAEADDVLFTPDVLPVSETADTDGNPANYSITVPIWDMTYTDDKYSSLGLSSQTTVDVGDYIAFYSGTLSVDGSGTTITGYAKINGITVSNGSYIVSFISVTQSEMLDGMAAYRTDNLDGDELLDGSDREAIERSVENQARESGFAEEAGYYLAALALKTDSFTKLSENYELTDYKVTVSDGTSLKSIQAMDSKKVDVKVKTLKATLNTKLVHFKNISGLRLTLDVGVEITVHAPKGDIVITITGSFEQEVKININVKGKSIWKWWGPFPYIDEYEVTASIDLYTFTGIGINASIVTKEADEDGFDTGNEEIENLGKQIKALMEEKDKYIGDGQGTIANTLEEKYAEMLETESDWVELFSKDIVSNHIRILLIIDVEVTVKFVVSANMNISLGCDFWYENAKRYTYTVRVFDRIVKNETINLVPEHYEFRFYVMGTMGLRAGIRAEIKVGLFSTKLASVGFAAEAGAYVRLWGYFFYELQYTEGLGRSSETSGALLFELGIYLEITFEAQAFNGTFKYNPTLYENEWPLWSAGMRENIRDFAYIKDDVPSIEMKRAIRTVFIPDSLFEMNYLDLKKGLDNGDYFTKIYSDAAKSTADSKKGIYFNIEMTNAKFSYDRNTNRVTVSPDATDLLLDGEMIVTWVTQPLAFSSVAIQRRIPLYWDNLNDGYAIVFQTNGGNAIPIIIAKYGAAVKAPANPVKTGYVFGGWYRDEAFSKPYTVPATMPNEDSEVFAKWIPANDTPYKIEYYGEILGSSQYELLESVSLKGTTNSTVAAEIKIYECYILPDAKTITILPDGSAVLRYYYKLQSHNVTFHPGVAGGESVTSTLKYGAKITAPQFNANGYNFTGWNTLVEYTMPTHDLSYTAQWAPAEDIPYRVEYYVEQVGGNYTLQSISGYNGTTGGIVDVNTLIDPSYEVEKAIEFINVTVSGEPVSEAVITSDGKLVIKVNYRRLSYNTYFDLKGGTVTGVTGNPEKPVKYGGIITVPETPVKQGYVFDGWDGYTSGDIMGTEDLTYTAKWIPADDTPYTVKHIREDTDGGYTIVESVTEYGTSESMTQSEAKIYEGFKAGEITQTMILPNGSAVVEIMYNRNSYPVNWTANDITDIIRVKYGTIITPPANPVKQGYSFAGWQDFAEGSVMGTTEQSFTAIWTPASDTVYTVRHIRENVDGSYPDSGDLVEILSQTGTTGTMTSAAPKNYSGFTAGEITNTEILADGSAVAVIYYTRNSYSITWLDNLGGVLDTMAVRYGAVIPLTSAIPVKYGYNFDGWQDYNENVTVMPVDGLTINPLWTGKTISTRFNANGGAFENNSEEKTVGYTFGTAYGSFPNVSKIGYVFDGWYTEITGGTPINTDTVLNTEDTQTFYVHWKTSSNTAYTVKHVGADFIGKYTVNLENEQLSGTTGGETSARVKNYIGFSAPVGVAQKSIAADGSTVVTINYERSSYMVTWMANGVKFAESSFLFEANITEPDTDPIKTGYSFGGWNSTETVMPAANIICNAQWIANQYEVAFNVNGGDASVDNIRVVFDGTYGNLPVPTILGYVFDGWLNSENQSVTETSRVVTAGNHTLTANWAAETDIVYTVEHYRQNINGDGYTMYESTTQRGETGQTTQAKANTYSGFAVADTENTEILADGSAVAEIYYDRIEYVTSWISEDGYNETQNFIYGAFIAPPENSPEKTGYSLEGWNGYSDGDTMPAQNMSYTAVWNADSYSVAFDTNGGNVLSDKQYTYDSAYGKLPVPNRSGYVFTGWVNEQNEAVTEATIVKTALNHMLFAHWTEATDTSYTVEHCQQNTNGIGYTVYSTQNKTGITNGSTNAGANIYTGFTAQEFVQGIIKADGSTVVKIYYDRSIHTIMWIINGDETTLEYRYGETVIPPETSREGYDFVGWDRTAVSTMPDNDLVYTAVWTAMKYNVSLDGNGGNNPGSITVTYDATYQGLPVPTRTGYSFAGWFTQKTGGTEINNGDKVEITSDHTLIAQWTVNTYTVSFNLGGVSGTIPSDITAVFDSNYPVLPECDGIKPGYSFAGWWTAPSGGSQITASSKLSIASNHTLYAHWSANTYLVIFDGNDSTSGNMETQNHIYDKNLTLTQNTFARNGYTFAGWNTSADGSGKSFANSQSVTNLAQSGGVTLYAQWKVNQYTITFNSNGGSAVASLTQDYGSVVTVPASPVKADYIFAGWLKNGESYNFYKMPAENITLTAIWTPMTYSITYVGTNGYTNNNPIEYSIESGAIILSEPSGKNGYTFGGWYTDSQLKNKVTGIAIEQGSKSAKTFYAKWTANTYTVVFHMNTGDGLSVSQSFTYDEAAALQSNEFIRYGYVFVGWMSSSNGSEIAFTDGQNVENLVESGNINLYAKWSPINYIIVYNLNGGTLTNGVTSYTIESGDLILPTPGKSNGYSFLGWYENSDFTGPLVTEIIAGNSGNRTYYAKWSFAGTFTVTNNGNNTFKIIRSGDGTNSIQNAGQQTVYFRTVNGSAIGGIHFVHQGENYSAVTFADGETEKTVTVVEHGVAEEYSGLDGSMHYPSTAYSNADRTYKLELVKVDGGGLLGSTASATRTMAKDASKTIPTAFYTERTYYGNAIELNITDDGWDKNPTTHKFAISGYFVDEIHYTDRLAYFNATASSLNMKFTISVREVNDGYQYVQLTEYGNTCDDLDNNSGTLTGTLRNALYAAVYDPNNGKNFYDYTFPGVLTSGSCNSRKELYKDLSGSYIQLGLNTPGVSVYYDASGSVNDDWRVKNDRYTFKVSDTNAPKLLGYAQMATGSYKAGETVTIAAIFDEIIASTDIKISGTNLNGKFSYAGGVGTNVIYFNVKLSKDCNQDSITNGLKLVGKLMDIAGNSKDIASNS